MSPRFTLFKFNDDASIHVHDSRADVRRYLSLCGVSTYSPAMAEYSILPSLHVASTDCVLCPICKTRLLILAGRTTARPVDPQMVERIAIRLANEVSNPASAVTVVQRARMLAAALLLDRIDDLPETQQLAQEVAELFDPDSSAAAVPLDDDLI